MRRNSVGGEKRQEEVDEGAGGEGASERRDGVHRIGRSEWRERGGVVFYLYFGKRVSSLVMVSISQ
jgi:hypothetical protein